MAANMLNRVRFGRHLLTLILVVFIVGVHQVQSARLRVHQILRRVRVRVRDRVRVRVSVRVRCILLVHKNSLGSSPGRIRVTVRYFRVWVRSILRFWVRHRLKGERQGQVEAQGKVLLG